MWQAHIWIPTGAVFQPSLPMMPLMQDLLAAQIENAHTNLGLSIPTMHIESDDNGQSARVEIIAALPHSVSSLLLCEEICMGIKTNILQKFTWKQGVELRVEDTHGGSKTLRVLGVNNRSFDRAG